MSTAFSLAMRRPTVSSSTPTSTTLLPKPSSMPRKATSASSSLTHSTLSTCSTSTAGRKRKEVAPSLTMFKAPSTSPPILKLSR